MTNIMPRSGSWIDERHNHAAGQWGNYLAHLEEVEDVWRGQFTIKADLDTPELEIKQPSEGRSIIKKMNEMLSIRADKRYNVVRFSNNDQEKKICDRLERFCHAYENELATRTGQDVFAMAGILTLLRGKCGMQTIFEKNAKSPQVRVKLWDPMEYFPVYSDDGIDWFTTEEWMFRWQLVDFFDALSERQTARLLKDGGRIPNMRKTKDGEEADLNEQVRVIQYWNDEWMAWALDGHMVERYKHGYGWMTLREAKINATPFKDKRWSQEAFFGPVVDALKMKAKLTSKIATSVEAFYYPHILARSESGEIEVFNPIAMPGDVQPIGKDGSIEVLNPQSNQGEIRALMDLLNNDIAKGTITDVAWNTEMGSESGFRANLALNLIKDSVADVRHELEKMFGWVAGDVLRMHKKYAPEGGWEYSILEPEGKHRIQKITADDIGDHQRVRVTITPALPQDLLQMATTKAQLTARDPLTGEYFMHPDVADRILGIEDVIGDMTEATNKKELDLLFSQDEEMKMLRLQSLKTKYAGQIREMQKQTEREQKKQQKRDMAAALRDAENGLNEDIVVPSEIASDPQKMQQYAQLIAQGKLPLQALEAVKSGMPMGMPGEQSFEGQIPGQEQEIPADVQEVMAQLMGQQPQPDGMTGYDNGINPMVMPSAMQGALPRPALDQDQLFIEQAEEAERRGALPPPR